MRFRSYFPFAILVSILFAAGVAAQAPVWAEMKTANDLLTSQKFAEAADAYAAIVKSDPANGPAWFQLGSARYSLKQYDAAAAAFKKMRRSAEMALRCSIWPASIR